MSASSLRLVFAGTPDFAAIHLLGLATHGLTPVAVYTQPDRPAGRGKRLTASPVKAAALDIGLPVVQPASLKDPACQAELAALEPDLLIVVAYGLILPQPVLDLPRLGCVNVHGSLLPRWRGAAPIQRAIEAGDPCSGITIMQMDAGLDTGPMLARETTPIEPGMTAAMLHDRLAEIGPPLLCRVIGDLAQGSAVAETQDDAEATYAAKIDKSEARLEWQRPAVELERQIRAFNPFPVCWSELDEQRVKVWTSDLDPEYRDQGADQPGTILAADERGLLVACGEGALRLTSLQLPGGKPLPVREMLRARRDLLAPGRRFRQDHS